MFKEKLNNRNTVQNEVLDVIDCAVKNEGGDREPKISDMRFAANLLFEIFDVFNESVP